MISFRIVNLSDFKQLYNWLNSSHVKEFWDPDKNFTFEEISLKYSNRLKENKIKIYIIVINNIDVGFIQTYFIDDLTLFKISGVSKGIDLYIGDKNYLHKGYGKHILTEFISKFVFNDELVEFVVIDPEVRNKIAIKAYNKAGFQHMNTAFDVHQKVMGYYMAMSRDRFFCNL